MKSGIEAGELSRVEPPIQSDQGVKGEKFIFKGQSKTTDKRQILKVCI